MLLLTHKKIEYYISQYHIESTEVEKCCSIVATVSHPEVATTSAEWLVNLKTCHNVDPAINNVNHTVTKRQRTEHHYAEPDDSLVHIR